MFLELFVSVLIVLFAYLLGSIPTGYLAGRWLLGIDIREHGSGSTGATNVLRTLGKVPAILVLVIDAFKGIAAIALVYLFYFFLPTELNAQWHPWLVAGAAFAAIIGHSKSIWLNFTGGKSVATSIGVLLIMSWQVGLLTLAVFGVALAISRIVSLSSIVGAIAVTAFMFVLHQPLPYQIFAGIAGIYVIWRHRSNIGRILAGTEPQLGQKVSLEQQSLGTNQPQEALKR